MIFREFLETDQNKIIELYLQITKEFFPDMKLELEVINEYIKDLYVIRQHYYKDGGKFFVVVIDNELIGMGGVKIHVDAIAELKKFRIAKNYRGRGLGQKILNECERICKELKIEKIILDTTDRFKAALKMYEKNGYEIQGKKDMDLLGAKFTQYYLHKWI